MNKALLLAGLLLVTLTACNKVDDPKTPEDSIRGTWTRTSGIAWHRNPDTQNVDTTFDYPTNLPSCIADDALEFGAGYAGITYLGSDVCNAGDPEGVPFRWETTGAGTGLRIYDVAEYFPQVNGNVNAKILTLTKTFMTLRYTYEVFNRRANPANTADTLIIRDTLTFTDIFRKQ